MRTPIPEPDHGVHYTEEQVLAYGEAEYKRAIEDFKADLAQALCEDCESGVKWLNEQAVERFKREYPNLMELLK